MTENVRKLVGVVAMAALVVVGVAVSSGDDTNFTRNAAYIKFDGFRQLPEAEQARLAPAFLQQAAPKALDTGPINKINSEVGPIFKGAKDSISLSIPANSLSTGKASVLEGRGVDGKGGTSSIRLDTGIRGKTGKAGIWLQSGGTEGVADRILECASGGNEEMKERAAPSIIAILIALFSGDVKDAGYNCQDLSGNGGAFSFPYPGLPLSLAECMESKVDGVFLKSHTEAMAADCVATVMPALSPKRAKQLGTYWQTPEQLSVWTNGNATSVWTNEE